MDTTTHKSPRTALITGIGGQDGSYLAELLLDKGYQVIGTVPPGKPDNPDNLSNVRDKIQITITDLLDQKRIMELIGGSRPDEIYNFASQSHLLTSVEDPVMTGEISGIAVTRILEAIRITSPASRYFQASSSEMFGRQPKEMPQTEESPFNPGNTYAAAKLYAHWVVNSYRHNHGIFACSGILYNHESSRRRPQFVSRKITQGAANIKLGRMSKLHLGNLDARRDWGFAGDFVRAIWLMLQQSAPDDFILATGETHSVRDLCEAAFSCVELDYREHVVQESADFRPVETILLVGDPGKARRVLGWEPAVSFQEMVRRMVESDLESLRNGS